MIERDRRHSDSPPMDRVQILMHKDAKIEQNTAFIDLLGEHLGLKMLSVYEIGTSSPFYSEKVITGKIELYCAALKKMIFAENTEIREEAGLLRLEGKEQEAAKKERNIVDKNLTEMKLEDLRFKMRETMDGTNKHHEAQMATLGGSNGHNGYSPLMLAALRRGENHGY